MHIQHIKVFSQHEFQSYLKTKQILQKTIQTPAGTLLIKATDDGIFQTSFVEDVLDITSAAIKLDSFLLVGTLFQVHVWKESLKIPAGTTISYHDLAHAIGKPSAFRAVANALGANQIAYFIPCHRIRRKNGHLGGYAWGIERKRALLANDI